MCTTLMSKEVQTERWSTSWVVFLISYWRTINLFRYEARSGFEADVLYYE